MIPRDAEVSAPVTHALAALSAAALEPVGGAAIVAATKPPDLAVVPELLQEAAAERVADDRPKVAWVRTANM